MKVAAHFLTTVLISAILGVADEPTSPLASYFNIRAIVCWSHYMASFFARQIVWIVVMIAYVVALLALYAATFITFA